MKKTNTGPNCQHLINTCPRELTMVRAEGSRFWDSKGNDYIDFAAGVGVNIFGYNDSGIKEAAINQFHTGVVHSSVNIANKPSIELAKKITQIAGPAYAEAQVNLTLSGAQAVEDAIRAARGYSAEKHGRLTRNKVVSLNNSFHGRTAMAAALTGQPALHPEKHGPFPEVKYANLNDMASMHKVIDNDTCAVIMELVQGNGGMAVANKDFVHQLASFLKSKDIVFIIDEIQSGIGRTGTYFAFQQYGITPDIVTMAKGLGGGVPIGATLISKKIAETIRPMDLGGTFQQNAVTAAVANNILSRLNTKFLASVMKNGEYIKEKLKAIPGIQEVWGMGMMIGAKLAKITSAEATESMMKERVIVLKSGANLRFLPPLNISKKEIDEGLERIKKALHALVK